MQDSREFSTYIVTPIPGIETGDFKQADNSSSFLIFVAFTIGFCVITCCVYTMNRFMLTSQRRAQGQDSRVTVPGSHLLFTATDDAHYNEAILRMTQSHLAASLSSRMATIPHPEIIRMDNLNKPPDYSTAPPPRYSQIYPGGGPPLQSQGQSQQEISPEGCPTLPSHEQAVHMTSSQDHVPPPREPDSI